MLHASSRAVAASAAILLLAAVANLPVASAADPGLACPTLPAWDAAFCWAGVAGDAAEDAYRLVTCDVVGGPACGPSIFCGDFFCP